MKTIYDRAGQARILTLDLDPRLRALLERRFASLVTIDGDLTEWTEIVIFEAGDAETDLVREVGFSPLLDPDGGRFGNRGFRPSWDHLTAHDGWFELTISFGSTFAYVLFISDAESVLPELCCLCRRYAGWTE